MPLTGSVRTLTSTLAYVCLSCANLLCWCWSTMMKIARSPMSERNAPSTFKGTCGIALCHRFAASSKPFILSAPLPMPNKIRTCRIPRNPNPGNLLSLKQSVTLTGLGSETFEKAVRGLSTLYQHAKGKVQQRGCQLRNWTPGEAEGDLTLTFSSRYLTPGNQATDDIRPDMAEVIDPLNILRPLLLTEVHTLDNAVFYWQRMPASAT